MANAIKKNNTLETNSKVKDENFNLILNAKHASILNFPLLNQVFELLQRNFSKSLKDFLNCDTSININENENIQFSEIIKDIEYPSMIGVIEITSSDNNNKSLVIFENQFVYTILDILLGGCEYKFDLKVQKRPFTKIEKGVIEDFVKVMINSINKSFENISNLQFKFKRLESGPNSILIASSNEFCKLLTMKVSPLHKNEGYIKFLIPYSTLIPYKSELSKVSLKGKDLKEKEIWFQYFENVINNLKLNVCVEHTEKIFRLKDLSDIKVGNTIVLNRTNNQNWNLVINNTKVSDCKLGQMNDKIAVEILDQIDAAKYLE